MKIVTVSFYKDFARYFSYVEDELLKEYPSASFLNLSLYPCAHGYWRSVGKKSLLLPLAISEPEERVSVNRGLYKNHNLNLLIRFTEVIVKDSGGMALRKKAASYIDFYEKLFRSMSVDLVIFSGDTRLPIEAGVACAKKFGVRRIFFEQGPFNTTLVDGVGVNANASFSGSSGGAPNNECFDLESYLGDIKMAADGNYWKGRKKTISEIMYDLATFLLLYPPRILSRFLPQELSTGEGFKEALGRWNKKNGKNAEMSRANGDYIALFLQVPHDAQMVIHSPNFSNMNDIVTEVHEALPENVALVVREHPLYKGRYSEELYQYIERNASIFIDNQTPLNELIDGALSVVVNNSTVGLDALRRKKTVVVLGDCYYAVEGVVYKMREKSELRDILKLSIDKPIDPLFIERYLSWLMANIFIPGHYQDKKLSGALMFVEKIKIAMQSG